MKKELFIYDKNKETLQFLREFFRENNEYSAIFIKDKQALLNRLNKKKPDVLITGNPDELKGISRSKIGCPVISMLSGDISKGLRSVMKRKIECYLISPFHREDFEYKLKTTISKKDFFETIHGEKRDLETMLELMHLISSTLDPKEVLYFVVSKIAEIINVTRCSMISIPPEERNHAYVISTFEDPTIVNLKLDLKKYPEIRKSLRTKKTVVIRDASKDPLLKEVRNIIAPLNIRSIVVIPIIFRNEVIGTLFLRTSRSNHTFTEREIRLCTAIANASTNFLCNAFLHEKIENEKSLFEKLAITDYLTGLHNVRYFSHRLAEEFSRAQRYKFHLSCLMIDLDYFKKINDTYGHRTGDVVLTEFAQLLKKHTRKSDVLARYGGEEFIVLLPQTSPQAAVLKAAVLGDFIKKHKFRSIQGKSSLTVSIGVSSYPTHTIKDKDDIITLADTALYKAKAMGRDTVALYNSRM
ncbi:MAG: sensor domain-containing diguanylate cyclase [Nitrospirae bacterium]|nr:sensor domain-containing diguanylate cyclase [Nitrospirota bacterium]